MKTLLHNSHQAVLTLLTMTHNSLYISNAISSLSDNNTSCYLNRYFLKKQIIKLWQISTFSARKTVFWSKQGLSCVQGQIQLILERKVLIFQIPTK